MHVDIEKLRAEALRERKRRLLFTSLYIFLSVLAAGFIVVMGVLFFAGGQESRLEWRGPDLAVRLTASAPHYIGVLDDAHTWVVESSRVEPGEWTELGVSAERAAWIVASEDPLGGVLRQVVSEEIGKEPARARAVLEETFRIVTAVR